MNKREKKLSNPFSTGGGGSNFETRVQAAFAVLMLAKGFAPCLPKWFITKIKLQGKHEGRNTDDLIVYTRELDGKREAKLLVQVKHTIKVTEGNGIFGDFIRGAWHDFQSSEKFTKGIDAIALITGPLTSTDMEIRTILELARCAEDAPSFMREINEVNFSSNTKRKKLEVFRHQLKNANNNIDISNDQFWEFMKSFYLLGYDLDIRTGVSHSLLHSLIAQYSPDNAHDIWSRVVEEVQYFNQNAGVLTTASFPYDIQEAFKRKVIETIPVDIAKTLTPPPKTDWTEGQYVSELAIAILLGGWDEKYARDKIVASKLANESFDVWIKKIREVLQKPNSPLVLRNGTWQSLNRLEIWQSLGARIFDDQLERFQQSVIAVLGERDPKFELPPEERFAAAVKGKVLSHSNALRKGMTESLALLGTYSKELINCSLNKGEETATIVVRKIFTNADWVLWGSLNNLLCLLAEAAPDEFLTSVETALNSNPCPFDKLFTQEGSGITGSNYMTGLLWALEDLAWDERYLSRVTIIFGELALRDPGENWSNRPVNSLITIFLPWLPQTTASVEKRQVAMQILKKEIPNIAWEVLIALLPDQHQMSSGSHKPIWRVAAMKDFRDSVSGKEYWNQITYYANMAVEMSIGDVKKVNELIKHLNNLPTSVLEKLIDVLTSDEIVNNPEEERTVIWDTLLRFISMHKRRSEKKRTLSEDTIRKISEIIEKFRPTNPINQYKRLFSGRVFDLYEDTKDLEKERKKLESSRREAIQEILASGGVALVIKFVEIVEAPYYVGFSLGCVAEDNIDAAILPKYLDIKESKIMQFIGSFIQERYYTKKSNWVDKFPFSTWSQEQIAQFLAYLPFNNKTWQRAKQLLGTDESKYWILTQANPYECDDGLEGAIDKLIKYNRLNEAIDCLSKILHSGQSVNTEQTVKALLAAVSLPEADRLRDVYSVVELIKALQENPTTNSDNLFEIEWAYVQLLDKHHGGSPKLLEHHLASNPDFFCKIIRLIYISKNSKEKKESTEKEKAIASNAYKLLREWKTPPGMQTDGIFSAEDFKSWLDSVMLSCEKSGHFDVALSHIGNVLFHVPQDPNGLWINSSVAEALNSKNAKKMRRGFCMGIYNSREIDRVDPTGKTERELAQKYRQQAEDVEKAGYQRFAVELRSLADLYDREADRIITDND